MIFLIQFFHVFIILSSFIPFFTNNTFLLYYFILYSTTRHIVWYIDNGCCFLSKMDLPGKNYKAFSVRMLQNFINKDFIKNNSYLFEFISNYIKFTGIILAFYKLGYLWIGVVFLFILIMTNGIHLANYERKC